MVQGTLSLQSAAPAISSCGGPIPDDVQRIAVLEFRAQPSTQILHSSPSPLTCGLITETSSCHDSLSIHLVRRNSVVQFNFRRMVV